MRNSSFTTLLMFLPLVAIPLLAIFGIPEFRPVSASSPTEPYPQLSPPPGSERPGSLPAGNRFPNETDRKGLPASPAGFRESGLRSTALPRRADPFHSAETRQQPVQTAETKWNGWQIDAGRLPGSQQANRAATHQPQQPLIAGGQSPVSLADKDRAGTDRAPAPAGNDAAATRGGPPRKTQRLAEDHPAHQFDRTVEQKLRERGLLPVTGTRSAQRGRTNLTWHQAIERLNQLGITDFVLQPGSRPQQFLFSCLYSPQENPGVVYRFEGEHTEPLQAVLDVLQQIEEHLQRRQ